MLVVGNEHMASARQDERYEWVEHAVTDLVRIDLVNRPNHPVAERPRDSQPQYEIAELEE